MKWYTHASIGANAIWLTLLVGPAQLYSPFLLILGAFAGILPDIDATNAKIQHFGVTGRILKSIGQLSIHRRFFHSIWITMLLAIPFLFVEPIIPGITLAFIGGYASHLIIDGFNRWGVYYLHPVVNKEYFLLPKKWRSNPGRWLDTLLFFIGAAGLVTFLLLWREVSMDLFFNPNFQEQPEW